jgi:hypothetical protein
MHELVAAINPATWVTVVNGDVLTFEEAIESVTYDARFYSQKHYDATVSYFHEVTHFWHSISTFFFHAYSLTYLQHHSEFFAQLTKTSSSQLDFTKIRGVREDLRNALFESTDFIVRTFDILEGVAVFNAYRICSFEPRNQDFLEYLEENFTGQSEYKAAYLYAHEELGEVAFDIFSTLCYLALQNTNPAKVFIDNIENIKRNNTTKKLRNSISPETCLFTFIRSETSTTQEQTFLEVIGSDPIVEHPILRPYVEFVSGIINTGLAPLEKIEDFFARPYHYLRGYLTNFPNEVMLALFYEAAKGNNGQSLTIVNNFQQFKLASPLRIHLNPQSADTMKRGRVVFEHSVSVIPTGLAMELDDSYAAFVQATTAGMGIVEALLTNDVKSIRMHCPHTSCTLHETRLCAKFYNFPTTHFQECSFFSLLLDFGIKFQ